VQRVAEQSAIEVLDSALTLGLREPVRQFIQRKPQRAASRCLDPGVKLFQGMKSNSLADRTVLNAAKQLAQRLPDPVRPSAFSA
jgi:hypothetical protein